MTCCHVKVYVSIYIHTKFDYHFLFFQVSSSKVTELHIGLVLNEEQKHKRIQ